MKRACIYVRVSTERQAEKVSPEAQEQDARALCEAQGYTVVQVYRDIEKYRVGGRMVEPSGTSRDRPGFKRMLADANAGKFDVIIAWREDRLYRGISPMSDVLECLKETGVEIELVKETFDKNFAPVKAWVASMELKARRERTEMGMQGRLASGKIAGGSSAVPYGYQYDQESGKYFINEAEAAWVRQIWQWCGEGLTVHEIRRRLIIAGVPQKGYTRRKYTWHSSSINKILNRDDYFTGIFNSKWAGQRYEIPIPPIMDADIYQAAKEQRARWKAYPAGKTRQVDQNGQPVHPVYALAPGLVYCVACQVRMGIVRMKKPNGKHWDYYRCNNVSRYCSLPGCARLLSVKKVDAEIWRKVWNLISEPDEFERALKKQVAALQTEETDAAGESKR
jgi:DNA invertase Pin-like site-specific DNA recombinase